MATNDNIVYYYYPQWSTGNVDAGRWLYSVQSNYETWDKNKLYEVNNLVEYNGFIYKASKFIYLKGMTGVDPVTAVTNIYGRDWRVWHCIGSKGYLKSKYKQSNQQKILYDRDKMPQLDQGDGTEDNILLSGVDIYYQDLSNIKYKNFIGRVTSEDLYGITPMLLRADPSFSETGDLDKPYENHDECLSRRIAHSPYNIQKSDYKYKRDAGGNLVQDGLADKYDKRASTAYYGTPPVANDIKTFVIEPQDYVSGWSYYDVKVGGTSQEFWYNWKTGQYNGKYDWNTGEYIKENYTQPQDSDMMYMFTDVDTRWTYWIYIKTGANGKEDILYVFFEVFSDIYIGATVTFHCELTSHTYDNQHGLHFVETQTQDISFVVEKDKHFPWLGHVIYDNAHHDEIVDITGAVPDFHMVIPLSSRTETPEGGLTSETTWGATAEFKSITNISH